MPVLKSEAACSAPFVPSGASAGRVEGGQLRTMLRPPPGCARRACERRAAAACWQVPAEPTMPRLNSQVLGF